MIRPLLWPLLAAFSVLALPVSAKDKSLETEAKALHALAGGQYCEPLENAYDPEDAYASWTFSYPMSWGSGGEEEEITLIRIWCMAGAYNVSHAYYTYRDYEGLMPLAFATPAFKTRYEVEDDIDSPLEGIDVVGMNATTILVNSQFDPETRTISSYGLWRGIGDASDAGTWVFNDGEWTLKRYEIDASYDGKVNPQTVVEYGE